MLPNLIKKFFIIFILLFGISYSQESNELNLPLSFTFGLGLDMGDGDFGMASSTLGVTYDLGKSFIVSAKLRGATSFNDVYYRDQNVPNAVGGLFFKENEIGGSFGYIFLNDKDLICDFNLGITQLVGEIRLPPGQNSIKNWNTISFPVEVRGFFKISKFSAGPAIYYNFNKQYEFWGWQIVLRYSLN